MPRFLHLLVCVCALTLPALAQDASSEALLQAGDRLNRLGLAIFSAMPDEPAENIVMSPWPIHRSLSLAFLGARGETRAEISRTLQHPEPMADARMMTQAMERALDRWNVQAARNPVIVGAPRLPAMEWNDLSAVWVSHEAGGRAEYLQAVRQIPGVRVNALDFGNPGKALVDVNEWIATATKQKISRLLPPHAFSPDTRFALTSAVYFNAPWPSRFQVEKTLPEPFLIRGRTREKVPTMIASLAVRSIAGEGMTTVGVPLGNTSDGLDFQFLIFLPAEGKSLAGLTGKLTPKFLQGCTQMGPSRIELHLPRFRVPPVTLALKAPLQAFGLRTAFQPGKADFGEMVSTPLHLDDIFSACEFSIDENGVSGAAAAHIPASTFRELTSIPDGTVVRVNRPFLFALQHVPSGACLFLGRVVDPR